MSPILGSYGHVNENFYNNAIRRGGLNATAIKPEGLKLL